MICITLCITVYHEGILIFFYSLNNPFLKFTSTSQKYRLSESSLTFDLKWISPKYNQFIYISWTMPEVLYITIPPEALDIFYNEITERRVDRQPDNIIATFSRRL